MISTISGQLIIVLCFKMVMMSQIYIMVYWLALRKNCPYSELFWSTFPHIRTEYGEIWSIYLYSIRMRENADQYNSEYGRFSSSGKDYGKNVPVKFSYFCFQDNFCFDYLFFFVNQLINGNLPLIQILIFRFYFCYTLI